MLHTLPAVLLCVWCVGSGGDEEPTISGIGFVVNTTNSTLDVHVESIGVPCEILTSPGWAPTEPGL